MTYILVTEYCNILSSLTTVWIGFECLSKLKVIHLAFFKKLFKTSCIAVMIKIHYEVTHFYKIQNVVKTEFISIQARKEHIPRGEPRIFFFVTGWLTHYWEKGVISGSLKVFFLLRFRTYRWRITSWTSLSGQGLDSRTAVTNALLKKHTAGF